MKDYYKTLELEPTATHEQIKTQHKLLLHAWHPDKFPDGDLKKKAHEKVLEINEAYDVLGNVAKRYSYDQQYREYFQSSYSSKNVNYEANGNVYNNSVNRNKPDVTNPSNGKSQQKIKSSKTPLVGIGFFLLLIIGAVFLNSMQGQGNNQDTTASFTKTPKPIQTKAPTFTPDPMADIKSRCLLWNEVDKSLLGKTICAYGEIVNWVPREEILVPEVGSSWSDFYYFSYDNQDFYLYETYWPDSDFPSAYHGCIEINGELKMNKTNSLYIEILTGGFKNWKLLDRC